MSHDDFEFEPQRGLPAPLPAGEQLLWQGSPGFRPLAIGTYHVRKVGVYFLALMALRVTDGIVLAQAPREVLVSCALLAAMGALGMAVLCTLAYFSSRTTVYTITSKRVLLRHGIALPMTMNIPFESIDGAALKAASDGTGDIALTVSRNQRVGYLITWPHLRPGRITRPEPSFRALRDATQAARILSGALAKAAGSAAVDMMRAPTAEPASAAVRNAGSTVAGSPVPRGAEPRPAAA